MTVLSTFFRRTRLARAWPRSTSGKSRFSTAAVGAAFLALIAAGCGDANKDHDKGSSMTLSEHDWQSVASKTIVFGHQSVGQNILDGLRTEAQRNRIDLTISDLGSGPLQAGFNHFGVGRNGDPYSKIQDFVAKVDSARAAGPDVAMMKFCYLDVQSGTNVRALADAYIGALRSLKSRHPETTFVAFTVPLTSLQSGPKAWIKRALGRTPSGYAENVKRKEFNDIVRTELMDEFALFDIARVESTGTVLLEFDGKPMEVLNAAFTDDGGHLNSHGASTGSLRLAALLANLPE